MDHKGTAKVVLDCAVGRFRDPEKADHLVLTLRTIDGDALFAIDRRMAERISEGLAKSAMKLKAPRHEN
jgi:hypothetical protein